ncbi:MAG: hydroxyacid dehydrogenase [Acidobacteria bacterium]|nr:MAG: hydroxyacid dehydrogenase [Acidobacteriota bacterium]
MKVLIGPSTFAAVDSTPIEMLEAAKIEIVRNPVGRKLTADELDQLLPGVEGIIAGLEPLTRDVLERSNLRVISRCGAGLSNVDIEAARELGVKVFSTPDAPTNAVAELTVGAMLAVLREVPRMHEEMRAGRWSKRIGVQIEGKTIVIIGYGRIGKRVAALLRPFGARILAVDPIVRTSNEVEIIPLEKALPQADIITFHASGEDEILGPRQFAMLKRGVFILNAARGGLVNEKLLSDALTSGLVAGGWIDTFTTEPYDGPLTKYPQLLLTPHIGSASAECRVRMESEAVENLLRGLEMRR